MKRILLAIVISVISPGWTLAQDANPQPQQTAPPYDARFEIIQPSSAGRLAFRLDRFTGQITRLVLTQTNEISWEDMRIVDLPALQRPTAPRFQMFSSGSGSQFMLLLDTATGSMWRLSAERRSSPAGTQQSVGVWRPVTD